MTPAVSAPAGKISESQLRYLGLVLVKRDSSTFKKCLDQI